MPSTLGVYIGRFQPFHNGHLNTIKEALTKCDKLLIVIGSTNKKDSRNPFTYKQRADMILNTIPNDKIIIMGLPDRDGLKPIAGIPHEKIWYYRLEGLIGHAIEQTDTKVILFGATKDTETSNYMKLIKEITQISEHHVSQLTYNKENQVINATDIRNKLNESGLKDIEKYVPPQVLKLLLRSD